MLWSGLVKINKIVNNDVNSYLLYIDPSKSTYTIKNISDFYKEINNEYIFVFFLQFTKKIIFHMFLVQKTLGICKKITTKKKQIFNLF